LFQSTTALAQPAVCPGSRSQERDARKFPGTGRISGKSQNMEIRCLIRGWLLLGFAFLLVVTPAVRVVKAQEPVPPDHYDPDDAKTWADVVTEDRLVTVRGQQFNVHFYRPRNDGVARPAIYACGDGGWRGLAPRTAQQLAHLGFAVAGIDSKIYLREFSSV